MPTKLHSVPWLEELPAPRYVSAHSDINSLPIASKGFKIYPRSRYGESFFRELIEDSRSQHNSSIDLFAAFFAEDDVYETYRFIFFTEDGFLQTTYTVQRNNTLEFALRDMKLFERNPDEMFTNIFEDINIEVIKKFVD